AELHLAGVLAGDTIQLDVIRADSDGTRDRACQTAAGEGHGIVAGRDLNLIAASRGRGRVKRAGRAGDVDGHIAEAFAGRLETVAVIGREADPQKPGMAEGIAIAVVHAVKQAPIRCHAAGKSLSDAKPDFPIVLAHDAVAMALRALDANEAAIVDGQ